MTEHDPVSGRVIGTRGTFLTMDEAIEYLSTILVNLHDVGHIIYGESKPTPEISNKPKPEPEKPAPENPVPELLKENPMPCAKCGTEMVGVEYGYPNPNAYDGVSEFQCPKCHYRIGRWSRKELVEGEYEKSEARFAPDAVW